MKRDNTNETERTSKTSTKRSMNYFENTPG